MKCLKQGEGPLQTAKKRNVLLAAADYIKLLEHEETTLAREKERLRNLNDHLRATMAGIQGGLPPTSAFGPDMSFGGHGGGLG